MWIILIIIFHLLIFFIKILIILPLIIVIQVPFLLFLVVVITLRLYLLFFLIFKLILDVLLLQLSSFWLLLRRNHPSCISRLTLNLLLGSDNLVLSWHNLWWLIHLSRLLLFTFRFLKNNLHLRVLILLIKLLLHKLIFWLLFLIKRITWLWTDNGLSI